MSVAKQLLDKLGWNGLDEANSSLLLTRKDLVERDKYSYQWSASFGDNPEIIGPADSDRVSRKEGYEVLDFINAFAKKHGIKKKSIGFDIEDMLHECPEMIRDKTIEWIESRWRNKRVARRAG
jgi:hypothetical protein